MDDSIKKMLEELKSAFGNQEDKNVSPELNDVIKDIAKTGRYTYSWDLLQPLVALEMKKAMEYFLEHFPPKKDGLTDTEKVKELENLKEEIMATLNAFTSAPFTIQRLSELITQPRKHYKTCAKFYRGVLKNLLVVSTVDPERSEELPAKKIKLEVNCESSAAPTTDSKSENNLASVEHSVQENGTVSQEAEASDLLVPNSLHQSEVSCPSESSSCANGGVEEDAQTTAVTKSEEDSHFELSSQPLTEKNEGEKENEEGKNEEVNKDSKTPASEPQVEDVKETIAKEDVASNDKHESESCKDPLPVEKKEPLPTKTEALGDKADAPQGHKEEPMDQS